MKKWICLISILFVLFSIGCSKREANPEVKGWFVFSRNINNARTHSLCIARDGRVIPISKKGGFARWSPDGEKILCHSKEIMIFDKKGVVINKIVTKYDPMWPVWYPDGKSIIYGAEERKGDGKSNFYIIRRDLEGKETVLHKFLDRQITFNISYLDISPDGKRIIFNAGGIQDEEGYIYIMNIDGTGLRELYRLGIRCSWYPDSKHILFSTNTDKDGKIINKAFGRLYKMDVDTGDMEIIEETVKSFHWGTRVSKNGRYLIYDKPTKEGGSQIMICPIGERTEDKEIPVTYSKLKQGRWTQDTNPDWWQKNSKQ